MANNLVVQLLLKTGTFSTDLKQAKGQIQNFQQGCSTAGKSLDAFGKGLGVNIGALTKFGSVIGIAAAAGKGFKDVMDSTQTTSDAFYGAIEGCKGVVEAFKISLATADFSRFTNGLWSIFDAAKAARDELDALQDAQLGYDLISADNNANFATARNNYEEAKTSAKNAKTEEERKKFLEQAEKYKKEMEDILAKEEQASRNFQYRNMSAIRSAVHANNNDINEKDVTEAAIMRAAEIFNSVDQEEQKKIAKQRAKEVMKNAKGFSDKNKRAQYLSDYDRQFDLVVAELIEMGDKKIQAVVAELKAGRSAKNAYESMRRSFDRLTKQELGGSGSGSGSGGSGRTSLGRKLEAQEGSLAYWQKIVSEKQKARDMEVFNSESWQRLDKELLEAIENVDRLEAGLRRLRFEQSGMNTPLAMPENAPVGKAEVMDKGGLVGVPRTTPVPTETINSWEVYSETLSGVASVASSLSNILGAVIDDETAKQWESFFKVVNGVATVFSALASVIQTVTALQKTFQTVTAATATANAAAAATESAAIVAAKGAEAGAAAAAAGAEGASAVAGVPVVGPALAIAAAAAIVAAIIAAMTKARGAGKFAYGGIVGGNSFTGDRLVANVNSGEMILNKTQQARLFKLANGGAVGGNQVEFHISGTELVGVIDNVNRKNRVIR